MRFRCVTGYNCLTIILAVILVVVSGYYYFAPKAKIKASVRNATEVNGAILVKVSATGAFSAVDSIDISSKVT